MRKLTNPEFMSLATANSDKEWEDRCLAVKLARGGKFPEDWHEQLFKKEGLFHSFMKRMDEKETLLNTTGFIVPRYYA